MVPQSIMPNYAFLADTELDTRELADYMRANQIVGVPYTDEDIAKAVADIKTQVNPDSPDAADFQKRYPKAQMRKFDAEIVDGHRSRRRGRLSPDARHARRLQGLRRQGQPALRRSDHVDDL